MRFITILFTLLTMVGNSVYVGSAHTTYEVDGITYYEYETDDLNYDLLANRNGRMIVEHIHGLVLDDDGNGVVLNTDSEYNYISYSGVENATVGTEFDTYLYYNPENNYEDDIIFREDYIIE